MNHITQEADAEARHAMGLIPWLAAAIVIAVLLAILFPRVVLPIIAGIVLLAVALTLWERAYEEASTAGAIERRE